MVNRRVQQFRLPTPKLKVRNTFQCGTKCKAVCKHPIVPKGHWAQLPYWIALHASRGPHRKCWEGHYLKVDYQDGRKFGNCTTCGWRPPPGTKIHACRKCRWTLCMNCSSELRLPALKDDPVFHEPDTPSLLGYSGSVRRLGAGTVIICPGGNYEFLCPHEGLPVVDIFNKHGINALVLKYRLLPNYTPQDARDDLTAAVKLVRSMCKGPVAALGFSAGGHLIASHSLHQGCQRKKLKRGKKHLDAQILVYPCIDPSDWKRPDTSGFWDIDQCFPHSPALLESRPVLLGGRGFRAPPTFLVSSTKDEVCPASKHGNLYAKALKRRRIPFAHLRRDFGNHGFGLDGDWTSPCIDWLLKRGFGGKPVSRTQVCVSYSSHRMED